MLGARHRNALGGVNALPPEQGRLLPVQGGRRRRRRRPAAAGTKLLEDNIGENLNDLV